MKILIQSHGFDVTEALSELIEVKLTTALGRHRHHVQAVQVRLGDENGPRGGVDKYCRLQVLLQDGGVARAADTQADLYAAVDRASHGLSRSVVKRLGRAMVGTRKGVPADLQIQRLTADVQRGRQSEGLHG